MPIVIAGYNVIMMQKSKYTHPFKRHQTLLLILAAFLASAMTWNLIIPPYENLDELEHAEVVRHIVMTGKLPVHDEAEANGFNVRQEASQPPLYHLAAAAWVNLWRLPETPHTPEPLPVDLVACGPSDTFHNKVTWKHPVSEAEHPWSGSALTIRALRLFSTLLQTATLIGLWTLAQRVFPNTQVPLLATCLVAFNPQFLLVASAVNNDNMVIPLATWGLILIYDLWDNSLRPIQFILLGTLCGLASLSKLSGLGLLGLAGIVLLIRGWQKRVPIKRLLIQGLAIGVPALIMVTPWLIRNMRLYGDPTALAPMLAKVGTRQGSIGFGEIRLMFLSYWGQLPCTFYPRSLYWPYMILSGCGLIGLALGWHTLKVREKRLMGLCIAWFLLIAAAWIRWNSMTPAPGGRLLFPAIAAFSLILSTGWSHISRTLTRLWTAFLPVWALLTLVAGPLFILAPPKLLATGITVPNPVEFTFGDSFTLTGYEARIRDPKHLCIAAAESYCAPVLELSLYWQVIKPVHEDAIVVIQLASPVAGNTDLRFNYNYWSGKGVYPTSSWQTGTTIRDHYLLPITGKNTETGAWRLLLAFIRPETGERLPVYTRNQLLGDAAILDMFRVVGINPAYPEWENPELPVVYSETVVLQDAQMTSKEASVWRIDLIWESQKSVNTNYTVFVHAYDALGNLLATGDGPPQEGGFPTSLWQPGDRILDTHYLTGINDQVVKIAVGLYDPLTGERLAAMQDANPLPDNASVIWETVLEE
ncbi:MAG: phospholipid carrier-dependent glycosyltransferase [Anaerolineales bacterium]|nr:MAG: phospholipid carrier-dependent glycosyltransferase [Anaerolineales bacterium]